MRIELKPTTVERIEELAGEKMTTRCDRVVNKALDKVKESDSFDMIVCNNTKKEMQQAA